MDRFLKVMQRDITILSLMKKTMTARHIMAVFGMTTGMI